MNPKIISLLYHEVTDKPGSTGFQRDRAFIYKHSKSDFKTQLKLINSLGLPVVNLNNFSGKSENGIILTFDDGGRSANYISKVLDKYNIKGHFFITTQFIGNKYFLSKKSILDLHKRGHIIGSHSHTHSDIFRNQSKKEMIDEWKNSKYILENILGDEV
jgi:peptidoglycan/xylan/chitin deacetylase (PgdA/CDA1 family)